MNIILFDDPNIRQRLLPFTYTRPTSEIRVGILTFKERWEKILGGNVSYLTEEYLSKKYPIQVDKENILIQGTLCPNYDLVTAIQGLKDGEYLMSGDHLIACNVSDQNLAEVFGKEPGNDQAIPFKKDLTRISNVWEIFTNNADQISNDFKIITSGRDSQEVNDPATTIYGKENLFVEKGAKIKAAIINAENGPVYIGKNAVVNEGALINGSFALCDGSHITMGAKIKGDTTIGPYCKVGGEVSNSVIFGFSNKAHDGFIGNSVIGEWCNIGADTNTSNLKNNYTEVKIWDYESGGFKNTGEMFCGLFMGDHSKCGINTMFNTGTTVGVASNIYGSGFPRTFIPSFSWGGATGFTTHKLMKVFETEEKMMARREMDFTNNDKEILTNVFELTEKSRVWEK